MRILLKKYNLSKHCFEGAFSNASYEAILVGVAENLENLREKDIRKIIEKMYSEEKFLKFSARGIKAIGRFQGLNSFQGSICQCGLKNFRIFLIEILPGEN